MRSTSLHEPRQAMTRQRRAPLSAACWRAALQRSRKRKPNPRPKPRRCSSPGRARRGRRAPPATRHNKMSTLLSHEAADTAEILQAQPALRSRWPHYDAEEIAAVADVLRSGRVNALQHGDQCRRSEEHTSELQSLMRISYAVCCLKKTTLTYKYTISNQQQHKN